MLFCTSFSLIWAHSLGVQTGIPVSGNHWDIIYKIYLHDSTNLIKLIWLCINGNPSSWLIKLTALISFSYVISFVKTYISVNLCLFCIILCYFLFIILGLYCLPLFSHAAKFFNTWFLQLSMCSPTITRMHEETKARLSTREIL